MEATVAALQAQVQREQAVAAERTADRAAALSQLDSSRCGALRFCMLPASHALGYRA